MGLKLEAHKYTTRASEFTQWNKDTLVVDPFLNKIDMASEIKEQLQSCFYVLEANKVTYIPFNPEVHKLDNQVKQEIVEDWQAVVEQLSKRTSSKRSRAL